MITDVIRGPYAFLLIVQVLIVSGLLLTLIWLLVERLWEAPRKVVNEDIVDIIKESDLTAATKVGATASTQPEIPLDLSGLATAPVPTGEPLTFAAPSSGGGMSEVESQAAQEESSVLKDKIKYLESRLMEYEIVQEEISSLSQLRVENEKLKEEMLKLQALQGGGFQSSLSSLSSTEHAPTVKEPDHVPLVPPPPGPEAVSQAQIDSLLKKLDDITTNKP